MGTYILPTQRKFLWNEHLTKLLKKTVFVLVGELVTFNRSMGFNVTAPGQKVTVYEGRVGLDDASNSGLQPYQTNIDTFKYSFFPRTIITWNNLPPLIPQASTVDDFKASINSLTPFKENNRYHAIFYPCTNAPCCTLSAAVNTHNHCLFELVLSDIMAMILTAFLVILYSSIIKNEIKRKIKFLIRTHGWPGLHYWSLWPPSSLL